MSVKNDGSGHRSVQAEVEVPGTPEEVWQAIATGPGISSWFVPTQLDEREGGVVAANFGPGMESSATITTWQPPLRFVAESQDMGPAAPAVATEWIVEAQSGSTCVVRVVHRWFSAADDWDQQFEGHTHGWQAFFRILRLYLTHFKGLPGSAFQIMGVASAPTAQAWSSLVTSLGIAEADLGQRVQSAAAAPPFAGIVERTGPPEYPELLLRLDEPAPGLAHLFALPMGGPVYLPIRFYLYGDRAADAVAKQEPQWLAWINERFASAELPGAAS